MPLGLSFWRIISIPPRCETRQRVMSGYAGLAPLRSQFGFAPTVCMLAPKGKHADVGAAVRTIRLQSSESYPCATSPCRREASACHLGSLFGESSVFRHAVKHGSASCPDTLAWLPCGRSSVWRDNQGVIGRRQAIVYHPPRRRSAGGRNARDDLRRTETS